MQLWPPLLFFVLESKAFRVIFTIILATFQEETNAYVCIYDTTSFPEGPALALFCISDMAFILMVATWLLLL